MDNGQPNAGHGPGGEAMRKKEGRSRKPEATDDAVRADLAAEAMALMPGEGVVTPTAPIPKEEEVGHVELEEVLRTVPGPAASWDEGIKDLLNARNKVGAGLFAYYWVVGRFALQMSEDRNNPPEQRKYGGHSVGQLAELLETSETSIHNCMVFHRRTDLETLKRLIEKQVAWRGIAALCSVGDDQEYRRLQVAYELKKITADQVIERAKEFNRAQDGLKRKEAKEKPRYAPSKDVAARIRSYNTVFTSVPTQTMAPFRAALEEYAKNHLTMRPQVAKSIAEDIRTARENTRIVAEALGLVEKALAELDRAMAGDRAIQNVTEEKAEE